MTSSPRIGEGSQGRRIRTAPDVYFHTLSWGSAPVKRMLAELCIMAAAHPKYPIVLCIAAALVTLALKSTAYWLNGSVSLLSDAVESLVKLAAALIALVSLVIAARPVDESHT